MLPRTLSDTILKASRTFPVILLTGPRQVGKTTLLEELSGPGRHYVTLDDLDQRRLAKTDPALFLESHPEGFGELFDEGIFPGHDAP